MTPRNETRKNKTARQKQPAKRSQSAHTHMHMYMHTYNHKHEPAVWRVAGAVRAKIRELETEGLSSGRLIHSCLDVLLPEIERALCSLCLEITTFFRQQDLSLGSIKRRLFSSLGCSRDRVLDNLVFAFLSH